jgi:hypothetical protein
MRVRPAIVVLATAGLLALTGCDLLEKDKPADPAAAASADPSSAPSSAAPSASTKGAKGSSASKPAGKEAGLPDVCTLLTKAEVSGLAGGRQVVQIDPDGASPDDTVRHCQWQISGARLAIFLSPTTASEFKQTHGRATKVAGVGDEAATDSGHLYVRHGDLQIDVYATISGDDAAGARMAKSAAAKVITKL